MSKSSAEERKISGTFTNNHWLNSNNCHPKIMQTAHPFLSCKREV